MAIDPPTGAPEFGTLTAFLDHYREVICEKVAGVDGPGLRRSVVATGTSLGGIIRHLAFVERWWFQEVYDGRRVTYPWSEDDPDGDWRLSPEDDAAGLIAFYRDECAVSREIVSELPDLDRSVPIPGRERTVSLRWILVHMIEETARHAGHADLLREIHDGVTG
jgi:uncharacterized damage-inducible protein DinB